jgi:hypothetical protein
MRPGKLHSLCALLVLGGLPGLVPRAEAICYYTCGPTQDTLFWGMGATCEEAEQDGIRGAEALIPCPVTCFRSHHTVNDPPCQDKNGMKQVDVGVLYQCLVLDYCEPDPPDDPPRI